ncbi:hypothetical protein FQA47_004002 [Oryzias melastigma]|uniref:Uncharacterized protein n=1 Tax=Oryzias melastigma TaxID=30732 RepID=A0A834F6R8_ORYME|nr:hypothetical protein FQA47_004002 [Oryzias melastigma]
MLAARRRGGVGRAAFSCTRSAGVRWGGDGEADPRGSPPWRPRESNPVELDRFRSPNDGSDRAARRLGSGLKLRSVPFGAEAARGGSSSVSDLARLEADL